jgi:hypothetical protein
MPQHSHKPDLVTPRTPSDFRAAYDLYRRRYIRAVVLLQELAAMTEDDSRHAEVNKLVMSFFSGSD